MISTLLTLIVGTFIFALVFKLIFGGLRLVFKLLGLTLALPFLIIGAIVFLPIIILGLGIGLIVKLLPLILGGGIIYLIYRNFFGKDKYWYN